MTLRGCLVSARIARSSESLPSAIGSSSRLRIGSLASLTVTSEPSNTSIRTGSSPSAWTAERQVAFDASEMRHFDHGYAVTSHSSQGLTAERVLVNVDTTTHPDLINSRFAYVSVSRASLDAHIYTNDAASLVPSLSHDANKTSALEIMHTPSMSQGIGMEI